MATHASLLWYRGWAEGGKGATQPVGRIDGQQPRSTCRSGSRGRREGTGRLDGWSSEAASLASTHPRWPRSRASARCRCEQVRRRRPWQRRWPPLAWHGRRLRYRLSLRGRRADPGGDVLGRGEVDGDPLKDVPVAWGGRHTRVIFQDAPHHESASGCPQGDPPERPHSKEGGYRFFRRVDGRRSAAEKWGICVPGG